MFTFVVSNTMPYIVFFFLNGGANKISGFLVGEHKRGGNFKRRGVNQPSMKLLYRSKKVLIKKVFHLIHKDNINKIKEVLRKLGKL